MRGSAKRRQRGVPLLRKNPAIYHLLKYPGTSARRAVPGYSTRQRSAFS